MQSFSQKEAPYHSLNIPALIQKAASTEAVPKPALWKLLSRFPANIFNPHSIKDKRQAYLEKNRRLRGEYRQKINAVEIPDIPKEVFFETIYGDTYSLNDKYLMIQKFLKENILSIEEAATLIMQVNFIEDFVAEPEAVSKIVLPKDSPISTKILANLLLFIAPKWLYDKLCQIPVVQPLIHLTECILEVEDLIKDLQYFIAHSEAIEDPKYQATCVKIDGLIEPINIISSKPVETPEALLAFLQNSHTIAVIKEKLAFINFLSHMESELERTFLLVPFNGLQDAFSKRLSNNNAPFLVKTGYSMKDSEKQRMIICPSFSMLFYTTYYQNIEPGTITIPVGGVPDFKFLAEIGLHRARVLSMPTEVPFIDINTMPLHNVKVAHKSSWTWHDQVHLHRFASTDGKLIQLYCKYCLSLREKSIHFEGKVSDVFAYWRDELVGDFDYPYMAVLYERCTPPETKDPKLQNLAIVSNLYQLIQRLLKRIQNLNPEDSFDVNKTKYFDPLKEVVQELVSLTESVLNQSRTSIKAVIQQRLPTHKDTDIDPVIYFKPWEVRSTLKFFGSNQEENIFKVFQDLLANIASIQAKNITPNR